MSGPSLGLCDEDLGRAPGIPNLPHARCSEIRIESPTRAMALRLVVQASRSLPIRPPYVAPRIRPVIAQPDALRRTKLGPWPWGCTKLQHYERVSARTIGNYSGPPIPTATSLVACAYVRSVPPSVQREALFLVEGGVQVKQRPIVCSRNVIARHAKVP